MKKNNLLLILVLGIIFCLQITQTSCVNDKLPESTENPACDSLMVTYDNQVKPIIDASCAFVGCHSVGFAFGDFTTYPSMTPYLNDSQFKNEVLITKDMPQGGTLTDEELLILECWVASNYAEN